MLASCGHVLCHPKVLHGEVERAARTVTSSRKRNGRLVLFLDDSPTNLTAMLTPIMEWGPWEEIAVQAYAVALVLIYFYNQPAFAVLASPGAVFVIFKTIDTLSKVGSVARACRLLVGVAFIVGFFLFPALFVSSPIFLSVYWILYALFVIRCRGFVVYLLYLFWWW